MSKLYSNSVIAAIGIPAGLAVLVLIFFVQAYVIMLLLGAVHTAVAAVPALSFWQTVPATLLFGIVTSFFGRK